MRRNKQDDFITLNSKLLHQEDASSTVPIGSLFKLHMTGDKSWNQHDNYESWLQLNMELLKNSKNMKEFYSFTFHITH